MLAQIATFDSSAPMRRVDNNVQVEPVPPVRPVARPRHEKSTLRAMTRTRYRDPNAIAGPRRYQPPT